LEGARWGKAVGQGASAYGLTELASTTGKGKGGKPVTDLRSEMPLIKIWPIVKKGKQSETKITVISSSSPFDGKKETIPTKAKEEDDEEKREKGDWRLL